jgi:hypothetical protein
MNRNKDAGFNQVPRLDITRSRFKRRQDVKLTMNAGKLIPFYVDEVLPGDTFSIDEAAIIRMTTPIFPVMDNCYMDIYYFFVPNRIIWDHWKEFMGEVTDKPWVQQVEYNIPQLIVKKDTSATSSDEPAPYEGSILDYMGIPTKVIKKPNSGEASFSINALPVRAYVKIWNEWFRDQNVDNPAINTTGDETVRYSDQEKEKKEDLETTLQQAYKGGRPLPVNKFHDYFTSALPSPQRSGDSVNIPLGGKAPVYGYEYNSDTKTPGKLNFVSHIGQNSTIENTDDGRLEINAYKIDDGGTYAYESMNLYTDMSQVNATTINQLRQAFQVQKYYEELARGGSRYREMIYSLFHTKISDKTVQIPEYLGGTRITINMSQVIQTSGTTTDSPQGNTAAVSVTPYNGSMFTKSFEEHGYVIGVCCIRHDHTYQQGLERMWSRKTNLDFYYPVFANLGEQAILKKELYLTGTATDEQAFGYQEAWAEYRMKPNRICGKFRSNATGTLDSWHYGDDYKETPSLSQAWMKEGDSEIQRTLAVDNEPQFIMDTIIDNTSVRPMPMYSIPGLVDHH